MSVVIQGNSGYANAASLVLAFSSNNTAGNTLVATSPQFWVGSGATITDSQGNAWVQDSTTGIFYCLNCKGGANTVTFSLSGAGYIEGSTGELPPALLVDQSNAGSGTGSTAAVTVTTTAANDLVVGVFSGGALTAGTGFTECAPCPGGSLLEAAIQATVGSLSITATLSSSASWYSGGLTFKAAIAATHFLTLLGCGS